jgi:hypothetical protein
MGAKRHTDASKAQCCTPAALALRRLREEDHNFKASLGYIPRHCLKKTKEKDTQL